MSHAALLVIIMAAVTMLLRFLPFLIFRGSEEKPALIVYLGRMLPPAAVGMLCVYCLRNVSIESAVHGIPEAAACVAVAVLQRLWHNAILSILTGTAIYMFLIQTVFA